ncbi:hypothetical protein [Solimonas terrae]|uniref:DUF4412 domain-containing protein n=1 Tax=Solimonas terrae TaxID=1396819 RepID=A0A6M2BQ19_9GAMM|nr:hypothetical protein [Solimonas terrae]NGY04702.1 hypothetical protein [Solimonas terrae]
MIKKTLTALVLAALSGAVQADASLNFVDPASGAWQSRISVAGDRLRVDAAGAVGGSYVVLDLRTRTLTQIDPAARATSSSSIEQVQTLVRSITQAADPASQPLLQLALENLPDAQRTQAESLLRQSQRDEVIPYAATDRHDQVAGYPCTIYRQQSDTGDRREVCAAAYGDLKLAPGDTRTLQTALGLLRDTGGPWLRVAEVPGLPIRYAGSYGGQAYAGSGQLQSISHAALPVANFDDPPGYRIISLFDMLSLMGEAR